MALPSRPSNERLGPPPRPPPPGSSKAFIAKYRAEREEYRRKLKLEQSYLLSICSMVISSSTVVGW